MAAEELRYLLASGYPGDSALRFVSDHRRLPQEKRFILARAVAADEVALYRRSKRTALQEISGKILFVDGYNVLITVEGLILGCPVYLCDDGFCRDTRGLFPGTVRRSTLKRPWPAFWICWWQPILPMCIFFWTGP